MERAYSGLRRKRKRAHSTKCPCCYSSEDEPENHTNLQKEKIKEGNQIIGQQTRRKKSVQTSEEENENREVSKVPCHPAEVNEAKKSGSAAVKRKTARETKEAFGSKETKTARLKQENSNTQQKGQQKRQTTRGSITCNKKASKRKNKITKVEQAGQLSEDLEQRKALDANKSNDTFEKSTKSRVKSKSTKTSVDKKRTGRVENNVSGVEKKDLEDKGKICRKQNSVGSKHLISSGNGITIRFNQNQPGQNSITAKKKKVKTTQLTDSESGSPRKQNCGKGNTVSKNSKLQSTQTLSKKKVEVFDHLFAELKKCPGQSKASISMATELFLNFTSEKLKYMIQVPISKTVKKDNLDLGQSVNTCAPSRTPVESKGKRVVSAAGLSSQATDITDNCVSSSRKRGFRKSEETKLSQAAEALVSFRTNPSVLRQEKPEVDMQNTGGVIESIAQNSIAKKIENPLGSVEKIMCSTSQDVEALMQVVSSGCEARLSETNFSFSSPAAQNNLASKVPTSCVFQGALPQSLTSSGNVNQITTCEPNFFTLGQLTSQIGAALTVQAQVQPEVTTSLSVSESPAVMSTGYVSNPTDLQNLQTLFCTTPQPSNFQIQSTLPPPATAYPTGCSSQPRVTLSQPLKGMEDVVSCVGSHSAALLWNVKPAAPVVYITSPHTLSGVRARNIVPNEGQGVLPFGVNPTKVSSLVVPNTPVNLQGADLSTLGKVARINQQNASHSMSHTVSAPSQRPILPREQNSSFPTLASSALQQPVTQGTSKTPGNSQPLGSMSLQSGILSVVSPLNRQPPTKYTTQMATLNTTHNVVSNTTTATPVSAKQAVKRFVHERTKSAELKRTGSIGNIMSTDTVDMPVTSSEKVVNLMCHVPVQSWAKEALNLNEQADASETSEFNLQQAASALLSISSQDSLDAVDMLQPGGDGDDSLDEPDDEVVFTSKGVFRVGDVDVDPKYNRIGREGYSCGKCGKIFTSLSYLARHIKRVCPDMSCRKWKCTMCDKAFRHPFGLQQHIYTHTGERPHKCSQCPKAFYSSNDLRRHSRIHSGERPYHCKHCEKSFATTISLKTHTYIHTGEKPHKCPHCPKTFATSSKLGRHIVTHSEERPFSCKQCPKSFNRSGDLRRHNMHVHETRDKALRWDDCNGPLGTLDCLNVDMDNHDDRSHNPERDNEASLQCLLCGERCESPHNCVVVSSHGKFNQLQGH